VGLVVKTRFQFRRAWTINCVILLAISACSDSPQQRLSEAILRGDIAAVVPLLDDPNVDVNWRHPETGTALSDAAAHDQAAIVQLLLQRGADPNIASDENMTPLHSAAYHGYVDIVRMLVASGAGVNARETRYGFTPLGYAAHNGHTQAIKVLLDAGADQVPIKDGRTPILIAQQRGHPDAANALMFHGQATDAAR
jgi:ankyrin repeat protein